mmetsp:Transcript_51469/g.115602  ORF Transcript_51469/g.115602 Transcript_51469/m.115602 type:complete len:266 (+) Transcript_51469:88-885(+)
MPGGAKRPDGPRVPKGQAKCSTQGGSRKEPSSQPRKPPRADAAPSTSSGPLRRSAAPPRPSTAPKKGAAAPKAKAKVRAHRVDQTLPALTAASLSGATEFPVSWVERPESPGSESTYSSVSDLPPEPPFSAPHPGLHNPDASAWEPAMAPPPPPLRQHGGAVAMNSGAKDGIASPSLGVGAGCGAAMSSASLALPTFSAPHPGLMHPDASKWEPSMVPPPPPEARPAGPAQPLPIALPSIPMAAACSPELDEELMRSWRSRTRHA